MKKQGRGLKITKIKVDYQLPLRLSMFILIVITIIYDAWPWTGLRDAYIISLNANEFIDATKKGTLARFINHSWWATLINTQTFFIMGTDFSIVWLDFFFDPNILRWLNTHFLIFFCTFAACQIVKQGSGQFWGKQGLGYLPGKTFLLELNWLTTITSNGTVVQLFAVYVGQLTAQYFLVPSLMVSRWTLSSGI